ncbi:anti-sigma factor [Paenibacillus typhae]|uniref:Sigma factor regulator N-terminal n=1 Tax=Paenibacillus typhae TaxID=1174501 RepID=A0A1G9HCB2_9BACL|nr:anti-sigma factor [Paenibacillus typhae]SDL10133.1 Sigma factor regulator N-terminal [Paenibacillus typhae]
MSEEFRERLRKYSEGSLPEAERAEMEQELEKLEAYQGYLDELMERDEEQSAQKAGWRSGWMAAQDGANPANKKPATGEKRIIRRGKWKARIANTMTVLSAFLAFTVISSIITAIYYSTGNRGETYGDVISSAIAVSSPNTVVHLSSNAKYFFRANYSGRLLKQVGSDQVDAGSYSTQMLFGLGGVGTYNWTDERTSRQFFIYPQAGQSQGIDDSEQWERLDKLPEGTVAEAYLSLDQLYSTADLLRKLEPLNVLPVWFAVDDGISTNNAVVTSPLGFPYQPIWHAKDMTILSAKTEKRGWFGSVTSSSSSSPSVEAYGSSELRERNFLDTLRLLKEYKLLSGNAGLFSDLEESLSYIEKNGVQLYGVVVTGPVKELLELQEDAWISHIRIGEVRLWNWRD